MISSLITLRLKRRSGAFDRFVILTDIYAIYRITPLFVISSLKSNHN